MQISIDYIFLEYVMCIYFDLFFIEKQAQVNRHEMILKKLFFFMYSGYFSCSNFVTTPIRAFRVMCIRKKNCRVLGSIVFFL